MEEEIIFTTRGWFKIPCSVHTVQDSKKCIVFVHGLTGHKDESHYLKAVEFFVPRWYTCLRFNYYSSLLWARTLHTSSITTHNRDLEDILSQIHWRYEEIYLVGHSLGGPSIVGIKSIPHEVKKVILWDPVVELISLKERCTKEWEYIFFENSGKKICISQELFEETSSIDNMKSIQEFPLPICIVFAQLHKYAKYSQYMTEVGVKNVTIAWATHCFREPGKVEELYIQTLQFIET